MTPPPDPLTERELYDLVCAAYQTGQPLPASLDWVDFRGARKGVVYHSPAYVRAITREAEAEEDFRVVRWSADIAMTGPGRTGDQLAGTLVPAPRP